MIFVYNFEICITIRVLHKNLLIFYIFEICIDSVIYKYRIDEADERNGDPIKTGTLLGEMQDEYPNHVIEEFIGGMS